MTPASWLTRSILLSVNVPVSDLDDYRDVLSPEMRRVWPVMAQATATLKGSLVGGTALTIYLRHRESFDLDFLAHQSFSGQNLYLKLKRLSELSGLSCEVEDEEDGSMHAVVNGVLVQVFSQPKSSNPDNFRQLRSPLVVDGMRVASLPDLLAMKLDVIMHRPKLRDYIDIAAIDKSGMHRIEDGMLFHAERYGVSQASRIPDRIIHLLEQPGTLQADRVFQDLEEEVLAYLRRRSLEMQSSQTAWRQATKTLTLRDDNEHYRLSALSRRTTCGAWMPIARAYCVLPKNHTGHHRSR